MSVRLPDVSHTENAALTHAGHAVGGEAAVRAGAAARQAQRGAGRAGRCGGPRLRAARPHRHVAQAVAHVVAQHAVRADVAQRRRQHAASVRRPAAHDRAAAENRQTLR